MNMPFTVDQFMEVFATYNLAIWPMQIVAYLLGAGALVLAFRRMRHSGRIISAVLSFFWIWNGAAYHLSYFSHINKAAFVFGLLFIFQGVLFFYTGVVRSRLSFRYGHDAFSLAGLIIILYAMILYPAIGTLLGHAFPHSPVYGVAPCPTTIFTFGLLLWSEKKVPFSLLLIPLFWAIVGTFAAISLGIREDIGLIVSGLIGAWMILSRNRKVNEGGTSTPGPGSRVRNPKRDPVRPASL
jgi:hypothetical protein